MDQQRSNGNFYKAAKTCDDFLVKLQEDTADSAEQIMEELVDQQLPGSTKTCLALKFRLDTDKSINNAISRKAEQPRNR